MALSRPQQSHGYIHGHGHDKCSALQQPDLTGWPAGRTTTKQSANWEQPIRGRLCRIFGTAGCIVLRFGHKRGKRRSDISNTMTIFTQTRSTIRTRLHIKRLSSGSDTMGSAYLLCREQNTLKNAEAALRDPNQTSVGRKTVGDAQNLTI